MMKKLALSLANVTFMGVLLPIRATPDDEEACTAIDRCHLCGSIQSRPDSLAASTQPLPPSQRNTLRVTTGCK